MISIRIDLVELWYLEDLVLDAFDPLNKQFSFDQQLALLRSLRSQHEELMKHE